MVGLLFVLGVMSVILAKLIMVSPPGWQSFLMIAVYAGVIIDWVCLHWRFFRDSDL